MKDKVCPFMSSFADGNHKCIGQECSMWFDDYQDCCIAVTASVLIDTIKEAGK